MRQPHDRKDPTARLLRLYGKPIRVLIADDHPLFAEALMLALMAEERIELVGHAWDGGETVELAANSKPDVVLMDVQMPVLDGIQATREVRRRSPYSRVVVLTSDESEATRAAAFAAGASAYLTKTCHADDLLETIRSVASAVIPFPRAGVA